MQRRVETRKRVWPCCTPAGNVEDALHTSLADCGGVISPDFEDTDKVYLVGKLVNLQSAKNKDQPYYHFL